MSNSPITPSTTQFRKLLFLEALINTTSKVSKVSDESVLSGVASGVAKISGKAEKDIALAFSKMFPDTAYGTFLDEVAENHGIAPRYSAIGSSVYLRVVGAVGTNYSKLVNKISGQDGIVFEFEDDFSIGSLGFEYVKVRSINTGKKTNVKPLSLINMVSPPVGNIAVINEVSASGGRDNEDDRSLRLRIKEGPNILARNTPSAIEQAFMKVNTNVLKVFFNGISDSGKNILSIATQNAAALSNSELSDLLSRAGNFLCISDNPVFGSENYGCELQNMQYYPYDIDFRCELYNNANPDNVRIEIQLRLNRLYDHRFFNPVKQKIEWDDILQIVKSTQGVKYVYDQYFFPRVDIKVNKYQLPRLRGFIMRNQQGQLIQGFSVLTPTYYPNDPDINFQTTVVGNI